MSEYTTKERNDAAEALAIAASSQGPELFDSNGQPYYGQELDVTLGYDWRAGGFRKGAAKLADDAFYAVPSVRDDGSDIEFAEQYAEAESWVRCGWSEPGDEKDFK